MGSLWVTHPMGTLQKKEEPDKALDQPYLQG